jgi:hypothetical protein
MLDAAAKLRAARAPRSNSIPEGGGLALLEGRRVARFIFATLAADSGAEGFATMIGGRIFSRRVPQAAALPACVIQLVSAVPTSTLNGIRVFKDTLVDVHLIVDGSDIAPLVPLADRADLILQGATGIQDGANVVKLVLDDEREFDEDESGKVFSHQVQTYRTAVHAT